MTHNIVLKSFIHCLLLMALVSCSSKDDTSGSREYSITLPLEINADFGEEISFRFLRDKGPDAADQVVFRPENGSDIVVPIQKVGIATFTISLPADFVSGNYVFCIKSGNDIREIKKVVVNYHPKGYAPVSEKLKEGKPFELEMKLIGKTPKVSEGGRTFGVMEGFACDGKYFYFAYLAHALSGEPDTERPGKILKYSISPFEKVGESVPLLIGHANDLAYDYVHNNLIVAYMLEVNKYFRFDGEAMKMISEEYFTEFGAKIWAVASQKSTGNFLFLKGSTLYLTDNSFKKLKTASRTDDERSTYTGQGLGMDDHYAYIPMSKSGANSILVVYDLNTLAYVTTLTVPSTSEIESACYSDGKLYINFYSSGGEIYEVLPKE